MMDRDPSTSTNNKLQSNHIPTLSGTVSDSEKFGADLNNHLFHNHVRPDTADAAVMAKRSARSSERPNSAQQFIRGKAGQSVEEVLELKSSPSSENVKSQNAATSTAATKTAKTNNYFPKVLRSNYNETASALVAGNKPDQIISQNGSPKTQSSPAQSLLTLPTGEPSTHEHIGSHGGGVSDVASVQNGPLSNGNERTAQEVERQSFSKILKATKECFTKSFKKFCAGIVISFLVATTWVSATHFLKSLYSGGIKLIWYGIRGLNNPNTSITDLYAYTNTSTVRREFFDYIRTIPNRLFITVGPTV